MEFFKTTFFQQKSFAKLASSLSAFEGAHYFKLLKREKDNDVRTLIKGINLGFTDREKRNESLSFLLIILPQCDNAIFNESGEKWFKLCAQAFYSSSRDCEKIAILKIMTFILKKAQELKELHTRISKLNNSTILFLFSPKTQGALIKPALDCLYEYLSLFIGESLKYKKDIEKYVCSFLNSIIKYESSEVESAAKVYAVLPIPGANAAGNNERGKQLMQLINFAHQVLDVLFHGINETEEYDHNKEENFIPIETLESAKLLEDPVQLCLSANLLINNAFIFISEFLSSSNCNFINVSPKALLMLVSRILQVEIKMVNHIAGQEMELLSYLLPSLHIRTVSLLQKIIKCKIGQTFYGIIGEQLVATLKSTNQVLKIRSNKKVKKEFCETPVELQGEFVKVITYQTLATLVQISEGRHKLPVELLSIIRSDIEISKDSVKLKNVKGGELNLNLKKKKKKGYSISTEDMKSDHTLTNDELSLKSPIVISALNLINIMLLYAHHSMPRALIKGLRDSLVLLLKTSLGGVYLYPEVRASLYRASLSYARFPHPLFPMDYNSLHYALIFGCVDTNQNVSQICKEGLSTMSFIMENPQISRFSDIIKLQTQLGVSSDDVPMPDNDVPMPDNDVPMPDNSNENGKKSSLSNEMEYESDASSDASSDVSEETEENCQLSNEEYSNKNCDDEEVSDSCLDEVKEVADLSLSADAEILETKKVNGRDRISEMEIQSDDTSDDPSDVHEKHPESDNEGNTKNIMQDKMEDDHDVSVEKMFASFVDADPDSDY